MKNIIFISMSLMVSLNAAQALCVKIENGKEQPVVGTEWGYTLDKRSLRALQRQFKGIADQAFTGDTDTCSSDETCKGKKYITCR